MQAIQPLEDLPHRRDHILEPFGIVQVGVPGWFPGALSGRSEKGRNLLSGGQLRHVVKALIMPVVVKAGDPWVVRVVLSSAQQLDHSHVEQLKQIITERTGYDVVVEAQFSVRR